MMRAGAVGRGQTQLWRLIRAIARSIQAKLTFPADPEELTMFRMGERHEREDIDAPIMRDDRLSRSYWRGRKFAEFTHF